MAGSLTDQPLPRLIVIANRFTQEDAARTVMDLAASGSLEWVQLRDHEVSSDGFRTAARRLVKKIRQVDNSVQISLNGYISLADELETGVHVGSHGPPLDEARDRLGSGHVVGYSAHESEEVRAAREKGADYCFLSPIFPTQSKPGHPGLGVRALERACGEESDIPIFALGGIRADRVVACREAGSYGVAVLSGIMQAKHPVDALRSYHQALKQNQK